MSTVARPSVPPPPGRVAPPMPPKGNVAPAPAPIAAPAPVAAEVIPPAPVATPAPELSAPVNTETAEPAKRKPGRPKSTDAKVEKAKAEKANYPGTYEWTTDANGAQVPVTEVEAESGETVYKRIKLASVPTDYNAKVHAPLSKSDFVNAPDYWEWKAVEHEKAAADCRRRKTEVDKAASPLAKKQAKLDKYLAEVEKLRLEIASQT